MLARLASGRLLGAAGRSFSSVVPLSSRNLSKVLEEDFEKVGSGRTFRLHTGIGEGRFTESGLKVKVTTGVPGLVVNTDWKRELADRYRKILNDVKVIPPSAFYRQAVEATTRYRLGVVTLLDDFEAVEREIGAGQVEELMKQADDELSLIPFMAQEKPWEDPISHKPTREREALLYPLEEEQRLKREKDEADAIAAKAKAKADAEAKAKADAEAKAKAAAAAAAAAAEKK